MKNSLRTMKNAALGVVGIAALNAGLYFAMSHETPEYQDFKRKLQNAEVVRSSVGFVESDSSLSLERRTKDELSAADISYDAIGPEGLAQMYRWIEKNNPGYKIGTPAHRLKLPDLNHDRVYGLPSEYK